MELHREGSTSAACAAGLFIVHEQGGYNPDDLSSGRFQKKKILSGPKLSCYEHKCYTIFIESCALMGAVKMYYLGDLNHKNLLSKTPTLGLKAFFCSSVFHKI